MAKIFYRIKNGLLLDGRRFLRGVGGSKRKHSKTDAEQEFEPEKNRKKSSKEYRANNEKTFIQQLRLPNNIKQSNIKS